MGTVHAMRRPRDLTPGEIRRAYLRIKAKRFAKNPWFWTGVLLLGSAMVVAREMGREDGREQALRNRWGA